MPRKKKSVRKIVHWTATDLKSLRQNAGKKTLAQLAKAMKRTTAAVQLKASKEGISLRMRSR